MPPRNDPALPVRTSEQEARAQPGSLPALSGRLASIDQLRGFVIALMVLDHVRDYFTNPEISPTDLAKTTSALFLTRWVTHFCAPTFIFLAGTSAYLASTKRSRASSSAFLLTRGLWLIAVEFSVVNFVWFFNFDYRLGVVMQVIWAIGASMCLLSLWVWLPLWALGAFGALLVASHNLLDPITPSQFSAWAPLWNVLHVQAKIPGAFVVYPLIPWVGVMALGYAFGAAYVLPAARRQRLTLSLGLGTSVAFVLLRLLNGYGDPKPWSPEPSAWFSVWSFLNLTKYPPSLLYLCMTLGPALILLWWFERAPGGWAKPLVIFGRVPLFAYVVHIGLAHLLAGLVGLALGFGSKILGNFPFTYPPSWGFALPLVYLAWLSVLLLLYPASRWFAELKARRSDWWLKYL